MSKIAEKDEPRLLTVGRIVNQPRWRLAATTHPHHELIVVLGGTMRVTMAGRTLRGRAGTVFLYAQGVVHAEWSEPADPVETLFVAFTASLPADWPDHVDDAEGRMRTLIAWIYGERSAYAPQAGAAQGAFLAAMLKEYARLAAGRHDALVDRLRTFVRERLAESLTLDRLAAHANLSKYHLIRRYCESTGRTPMEDVRLIRLDHARDLLLTTDLPLKEIAPAVGLRDVFQLSRLFRRRFGAPPSAMRQRVPLRDR